MFPGADNAVVRGGAALRVLHVPLVVGAAEAAAHREHRAPAIHTAAPTQPHPAQAAQGLLIARARICVHVSRSRCLNSRRIS